MCFAVFNSSNWMAEVISHHLEPFHLILSQASATPLMTADLINIFCQAFLNALKNNEVLKWSASGKFQFQNDIETLWDWILASCSHAVNSIPLAKLKMFFATEETKKRRIIQSNRVLPTINDSITSSKENVATRIICLSCTCPNLMQY